MSRRSTALGFLCAAVAMWGCNMGRGVDPIHEPYKLGTGLVSRSVSFENPTGEPGKGGMTASKLGVGRKGSPARGINPGDRIPLCNIRGNGTIRHIWMTTSRDPDVLRNLILRVWFDDQDAPSIECPIGDFMGVAHGKVMPYHSAVHSMGENAGMNIWLPMPFTKCAKMILTNEGKKGSPLYYQIDYTLGDRHPGDVGRLHCCFRRENPTTRGEDFELMPKRVGKGRFIGSIMGIRNTHPDQWWGEGEMKAYLDGDEKFPTICGTGSEDYVGLSWGMQQTPYLYNGCCLNAKHFVTMYRWHLPDPICWEKEGRVTIQQIAAKASVGLMETEDDWSCASFWYEPVPSAPLPAMPDVEARTKDIWKD